MKKIIAMLVMGCLALGIAGCRDANVDAVKSHVESLDKQKRSLETLLSARLDNIQWKSFESDTGQKIVEAKGVWKDKFFQQVFEKYVEEYKHQSGTAEFARITALGKLFPMPGDQVVVQYVVSDAPNGKKLISFEYGKICDAKGNAKESMVGKKFFKADSRSIYRSYIPEAPALSGGFMKLFTEDFK